MALIYDVDFNSDTRVLSLLDKAGNVISSCEVPSKELVDDPNKPLMLRATKDNSSVTLGKYGTLKNKYQTSTDGINWKDYSLGTKIPLSKGEYVYFRCSNNRTMLSNSNYVEFVLGGEIEAWHNAYSMISSSFTNTGASVGSYGMYGLFKDCIHLTKAPLLLNTLADNCYAFMFYGCKALTRAPALPATTLANSCYFYMFSGCSKLKEVRVSATTTATNALGNWLKGVSATGDFYCDPNATIFPTGESGCPSGWTRRNINLINALTLTATADNSSVKLTKNGTLSNTFEVDTGNGWTAYEFDTVIPLNAGQSCKWRCSAHPTTQSSSNYVKFAMTGTIEASGNCNSMLSSDFENLTSLSWHDYAFRALFYGCTSLTRAPSLPAMTLAKSCYLAMFYDCKALTRVPSLPATTLAEDCYSFMFSGCSKLKEVRISATTTATDALGSWLSGVSVTGNFYCDPDATIFPTNSASGIPQNWTRKPLSDYPNP